MKILTWDTANFGDRLNEVVWPNYLGRVLDDDEGHALVGIGSLLNHRLPALVRKSVFGSGVGHGRLPTVDESWRVHWLRGPRSVAALGQDHKFITDPAVLLAEVMPRRTQLTHRCSFIPHESAVYADAVDDLTQICRSVGINFINPHWPIEHVLRELWASECVITEALHGAILADAYRIPWTPVARQGVFAFKWHDWAESIGLAYRPTFLSYRPQWFDRRAHPKLSRRIGFPIAKAAARLIIARELKNLAVRGPWTLSAPGVINEKIAEMKRELARVNDKI